MVEDSDLGPENKKLGIQNVFNIIINISVYKLANGDISIGAHKDPKYCIDICHNMCICFRISCRNSSTKVKRELTNPQICICNGSITERLVQDDSRTLLFFQDKKSREFMVKLHIFKVLSQGKKI